LPHNIGRKKPGVRVQIHHSFLNYIFGEHSRQSAHQAFPFRSSQTSGSCSRHSAFSASARAIRKRPRSFPSPASPAPASASAPRQPLQVLVSSPAALIPCSTNRCAPSSPWDTLCGVRRYPSSLRYLHATRSSHLCTLTPVRPHFRSTPRAVSEAGSTQPESWARNCVSARLSFPSTALTFPSR
jgi:hypothetical protein